VESRKRRPVSLSDGLLDTLDQCWREYDSTPAATLADVLRGCVAQLTAHARQIVTLRYVQGLSGIQVAETLGRNVRTVYMALSRIHGRLRRCVQERMTGGEGRDV
jgi:RNA polymerase sigma-70 factor (ECF subfamily)